jgi:hypothetical protein
LPPTGMFSMKSSTPYTIFLFAPPSNTLKDTKTLITSTIASLLTQLNVDADTAAGNFQSQHGCHRPASRSPSTPCWCPTPNR